LSDTGLKNDLIQKDLIQRALFGIGILAALYMVSRHNYLVFHTLAEFFSIAVAWSLFLIFWNTREVIENKPLILLGVSYLFVGSIDLMHTLSYKGMGVLGPETGANPATQLWIFARYLESLTLFVFASMRIKEVNAGRAILFFSAVVLLGLLSIFYWETFPLCYVDGIGLTKFKIFSEYLICGILILALLLLKTNKAFLDEAVYRNMVAAIILTISAELAFTFYVSVYGLSNLLGHFFKIASFYFVYRALVRSGLSRPYATLFRNIEMEKEALRISEKKHREILKTAIDGFWLTDRNGRIRQVNESYCLMSGYGEQELLGMTISDIEALETSADVDAHMEKVVAESGDRFETRHRRKDGTEFDVEISVQYQSMTGEVFAFIRDITDQKKDTAKLERATDLLGQISGVQSSFIATGSVQDTFDRLLESLVSMTGSEFGFLDEVLTDSDGSLYKQSLAFSNIAWDEKSLKLYEGLRAKNLEFRNLKNLSGLPALTGERLISNDAENDPKSGGRPDGHPPIRTFMGMPLYFADKLVGVAGVANRPAGYNEEMADFLEPFLSACGSIIHASRQQAKEEAAVSALRESENFLETVIENIPHMIFVKDAKDLRFIRFNRSGERLLGYDRKEMIGKNDHDIFSKNDADFFTRTDRDAIKQGVLCEIAEEEVHTRQKGRRVLHTKKIPLMDESGEPRYLIGISEDITERKRTEAQLRQAQKMESVGTLAGGIAHDFNNILFPIIGMSEILTEDLSKGSLEHENAQEILKAGKRGRNLVNQILAFSRRSETKIIPLHIQTILQDVLKLMRSTIPANIKITQHIKSDCGLVNANSTQIHQIAMNLITNAYHAVESTNGKISVTLEETMLEKEDMPVDDLLPGMYATLSVSDTGEGIDPEALNKIFEPYFTTKEQGKGTGLGLAVVYGIIKEYGGRIKVDSQVGVGTTFKVYFPLMEKNTKPLSTETLKTSPTGSERILLVDDEEAILKVEKQMLERLGYRVTELNNGLEALKIFTATPFAFDLVVSDMNMPHMTGDRLARNLITIRPDIPIIICTGYSEGFDQGKAESVGAKGFLMKPIIKSEMAKMVRKVLDESNLKIKVNGAPWKSKKTG